jgi:signal peptidase I
MATGVKRRFSYTDQKIRRGKVMRAAAWVLLIFLCYEAITGIFLSPRIAGSKTMEPGIRSGDRVLVSPIVYGAHTPFSPKKLPGIVKPKRGDLVLVSPPYARKRRGFAAFFRPLVRFFTFQTLAAQDEAVIKRVVALPGDSVLLRDSVISVNPGGNTHFLSEFELSAKPYDILKAKLPEGWSGDLPFSDSFAEIKLGEGQYFFMNDDRGASNDSRAWGSLSEDRILGKVLVRFWPLFRK